MSSTILQFNEKQLAGANAGHESPLLRLDAIFWRSVK